MTDARREELAESVFIEMLVNGEFEPGDAEKIQVNLLSPDGDAKNLIAVAKTLSNELGYDWNPIFQKMTSGSYDNLVKVFIAEFGDLVEVFPNIN